MTSADVALARLAGLRGVTRSTPPKGAIAVAAVILALAVIVGLAIYVGVPVASALLVFPALGASGWVLAGLTLGVVVLWGVLLTQLTQRLPHKA